MRTRRSLNEPRKFEAVSMTNGPDQLLEYDRVLGDSRRDLPWVRHPGRLPPAADHIRRMAIICNSW